MKSAAYPEFPQGINWTPIMKRALSVCLSVSPSVCLGIDHAPSKISG